MGRTTCAALGALLWLSAIAAPPSAAQPYTWTDQAGVTHYTADPQSMPPEHRPVDLPAATETSLPAPDPPPSQPVDIAPAPVATSSAGTVVNFSPGAPIVITARLNGASIALVLDTGADRTLLSPAAVARAGYASMVVPSGPSVQLVGVTGTAVASQVTVPLLDVAGTQVGPLPLIVHDAGLGSSVDGLLGRDVLDSFTVTIDAAAGRATLTPR